MSSNNPNPLQEARRIWHIHSEVASILETLGIESEIYEDRLIDIYKAKEEVKRQFFMS